MNTISSVKKQNLIKINNKKRKFKEIEKSLQCVFYC